MASVQGGTVAWEQQMERLARDRGPALVGYAYLLTGDLQAAQDLVQEALVRTFSRRRPDDVEFLEAYVRRAVLHEFLNSRRSRRRWGGIGHLMVDRSGAAAADMIATDRADVAAALARLTPRERACVVLRHFDDLTVRGIAARLDLSEGAVKRYLYDARRRLAPMLGADDVDVDVIPGGARR